MCLITIDIETGPTSFCFGVPGFCPTDFLAFSFQYNCIAMHKVDVLCYVTVIHSIACGSVLVFVFTC